MSTTRPEVKIGRAVAKSESVLRLSNLPESGENGLSEQEFISLNRSAPVTAAITTETEERHC